MFCLINSVSSVAKLAGLQRLDCRTDTGLDLMPFCLFVKFVSVEHPRIDSDSIGTMTACLVNKFAMHLKWYMQLYLMRAMHYLSLQAPMELG